MYMKPSPLVAAQPACRHIIWDWNGTLLQDGAQTMGAVSDAFRTLGIAEVTVPRHQDLFHRPVRDFFDDLAGRRLSDEEHAHLVGMFQRYYADCDLRECVGADTIEALETWASLGFTQSVLSMCPHDELTRSLGDLGLTSYFNRIEGYSGTGPDTKAAHLVAHLAAIEGLDPRSVALIGDTTDDAHAAEAAQIGCILYHSGQSALQSFERVARTGRDIVSSLLEAVALARSGRALPGH